MLCFKLIFDDLGPQTLIFTMNFNNFNFRAVFVFIIFAVLFGGGPAQRLASQPASQPGSSTARSSTWANGAIRPMDIIRGIGPIDPICVNGATDPVCPMGLVGAIGPIGVICRIGATGPY